MGVLGLLIFIFSVGVGDVEHPISGPDAVFALRGEVQKKAYASGLFENVLPMNIATDQEKRNGTSKDFVEIGLTETFSTDARVDTIDPARLNNDSVAARERGLRKYPISFTCKNNGSCYGYIEGRGLAGVSQIQKYGKGIFCDNVLSGLARYIGADLRFANFSSGQRHAPGFAQGVINDGNAYDADRNTKNTYCNKDKRKQRHILLGLQIGTVVIPIILGLCLLRYALKQEDRGVYVSTQIVPFGLFCIIAGGVAIVSSVLLKIVGGG